MGISKIPASSGGGGGSGTVTSVSLALPTSIFDVSGSPVTGSGTLTAVLDAQAANTVFTGPSSGAAAAPAFRSLDPDDVPDLDLLNGLLVPSTQLDATGTPSNTTFLRGDDTWSVPAGSGTVTSVGLTMPAAIFDIAGSPVTTAGTLAVTLDNQTANTGFLGPASGGAAAPAFRALVTADLPAGVGTVTSVALALPTSVFDISGSPVTGTGTLTATFDNQSANTVFAGPGSGGATTPAFRALVTADIPTPTFSTQGSGFLMVPVDTGVFQNGANTFSNNVTTPFFVQFVTKGFNLTCRSLQLRFGGGTASASAGTAWAIYDAAGTKVTNGDATSQILNGTTGVINFAFPTPPMLTCLTVYWLGFATEQLLQLWLQTSTGFGIFNELPTFYRIITGTNVCTGTGATLTLPGTIGATRTFSADNPISGLLLP